MKKLLTFTLALIGLGIAANAAVTIAIDAGQLLNDSSVGLTSGTSQIDHSGDLVLLVDSPSGTWGSPGVGSYVSGDNFIVAAFAMNQNNGTNELAAAVNFAATAGQSLAIYWFDSITYGNYLASTTPSIGTYWNYYHAVGTPDGGDPWTVPSAGSNVNFNFWTNSAGGGSQPNSAGVASQQVPAPEPSSIALLGSGLLMLGSMVRRRK